MRKKLRWHKYKTENSNTSLMFVKLENGSNRREYVKLKQRN